MHTWTNRKSIGKKKQGAILSETIRLSSHIKQENKEHKILLKHDD